MCGYRSSGALSNVHTIQHLLDFLYQEELYSVCINPFHAHSLDSFEPEKVVLCIELKYEVCLSL